MQGHDGLYNQSHAETIDLIMCNRDSTSWNWDSIRWNNDLTSYNWDSIKCIPETQPTGTGTRSGGITT